MPGCLICGGPVEPFVDFGRMPIANAFLRADQIAGEYFFDLRAGFCPGCTMVQLLEQPDRERMFHDQYPFFTSSSARMTAHFRDLARSVRSAYAPGEGRFVV